MPKSKSRRNWEAFLTRCGCLQEGTASAMQCTYSRLVVTVIAIVASASVVLCAESLRTAVFVGIPLPGHLNPLIAQAVELHTRGWQVYIASTERARSHVEGSGHQGIKFLSSGPCAVDDYSAVMAQAAQDPDFSNGTLGIMMWCNAVWGCMYDGLLETVKKIQPAVVITDGATFAGFDLAVAAGVQVIVNEATFLYTLPATVVGNSPDALPTMFSGISIHDMGTALGQRLLLPPIRLYARHVIESTLGSNLNAYRAARGLPPVVWYYELRRKLVLMNVVFGIEYAQPVSPLVHLVGPMIQSTPAVLSDDDRTWLEGSPDPVIFVNMGTIAPLSAKQVTDLAMGCMAAILLERAVQSLLSPMTDTGQEEYCSAGYSVLPAIGASLVVSKFWSRSVTQPFQLLWLAGVHTPLFAVHALWVL